MPHIHDAHVRILPVTVAGDTLPVGGTVLVGGDTLQVVDTRSLI